MVKIAELSIGDWVCYTGKCIDGIGPNRKITYIERDTCGLLIGLDYGGFHYSSAKIEDIVPIPLTPEILEKNGISKTYESDEYAVYKGEGFNVTEYYTELWEFEIRRNRLTIRNVHQLQHAMRLAGIEKEIEL